MPSRRNLLLVSYDCARADAAYKGALVNLERLARNGVRCLSAISSAPLTPVSHATVFTGLQPYRHGLRHLFREKLNPIPPTLAGHLLRHGFVTGAVVSCPGLSTWYGFNRGFIDYDDAIPLLPDGRDPLNVPDVKLRGLAMKRAQLVSDLGLAWLEQRDPSKRWFLFLHYFDAHWPYEPPEKIGNPGNPYEGELHYSDYHFGRVLQRLDERGELNDTLVILFGDHGEDLAGWYDNDKAGAERGHPEEEGHGCLLFQQTQHVPLVFSHPDLTVFALERPVGLIDIFPTAAGLLDVPTAADVDGLDLSKDLLAGHEPPHRVFYAETLYPREMVENTREFETVTNLQALWLTRYLKTIRSYGDETSALVYDLARDPDELDPVPLEAAGLNGALPWPVG